MNKTETKKIIASMVVTFPNYKPTDMELTVEVWTDALNDYSYTDVSSALKSYIRSNTSGFAPTPGQLIEKIQLVNPLADIPTAMEAWSMVSKALRNSAYNAEQEFSKLPPLVQKAVGSPVNLKSWATDENYNEPVLSSQFMKDYRMEAERAKEILKLPENTRQQIAARHTETAQIETKRDEAQKYLSEKDKAVYGANRSDTPPAKTHRVIKLHIDPSDRNDYILTNFCANCGAKMDKED